MKILQKAVLVMVALLLGLVLCPVQAFAGEILLQEDPTVTELTDTAETVGEEIIASGTLNDNITWKLDDKGTLTISGTGKMLFDNNPANLDYPWWGFRHQITNVVVEEGITTVGKEAFLECSDLTSITLPESITEIWQCAFYNCKKLESINIPESVTVIREKAFYRCESLTSIDIPEGVSILDVATFFRCESLESITLPESLTEIGASALYRCSSLKSITIPNNVTDIGYRAFYSCTSLESVTLSEGLTNIRSDAFHRCAALKSITIPDSIIEIEGHAFGHCDAMTYVIFPESMTQPRSEIFYNTVNVKHVLCKGSDTFSVWGLYDAVWHYSADGTEIQWVENCVNTGYFCSICNDFISQEKEEKGSHVYTDDADATCNVCGEEREVAASVPMHRMYDPNSGEHFYTGADLERDFLVEAGWHYEGVGFNFPEEGAPVHRLYDPVHGEHLYTMNKQEMNKLLDQGWQYEGVAFNSAGSDAVPQYRLHNPNAKRGGYHFTGSEVERDLLISFGWIDQGIGWYSCLE